jgi:hypothetical protein
MISQFFRRPNGVGSRLNIYMFSPPRLLHAAKLLLRNPQYFRKRIDVMIYQILHPEEPWLTRDAISFLKSYLRPHMIGFEWGSGISTRWFGQRLHTLVSVEDDEQWYTRITPQLTGNVNYRYEPDPLSYVEQISFFPDAHFDLIVIDGSFRDACILAASNKIKIGGAIVLDNADQLNDCTPLTHFNVIQTDNGVWRTNIYIRLA